MIICQYHISTRHENCYINTGYGNCLFFFSQGLFDIQMATVSNYSPGTVNVSCTFARHSRALGCLVVLHPQNTSQTVMFAYAARDNSSAPTANISIHGVPKGSHTVLVFDGEQNGLLSARAAAVQNVTVAEGGPGLARSSKLLHVLNSSAASAREFHTGIQLQLQTLACICSNTQTASSVLRFTVFMLIQR